MMALSGALFKVKCRHIALVSLYLATGSVQLPQHMMCSLISALNCICNMVLCKTSKSLQVVQQSVPQMPLELVADVSSTQHGAMIDEVLVAPCARPAGVLPPLPDIQESDQISLSYCKPAQLIKCLHLFCDNQSLLRRQPGYIKLDETRCW